MTIITGLKITKHKPKAWVLSSLQALLCTLLLTLLTACSALDRSSGFDSIKAYAYPGVTSLTQSSTGGFLLAWPKMPDSGATYSVYLRRSNLSEAYNFSTDPLLSATTTTADVAALPLNNTYCFVVRAQSNNYRTDSNVKEVCSGGDGVSDFTGIAAAVSMLSGQAVITWTPSSNINVTGYNIYQGSGMAVKITSAQPSVSSAVVSGLVPGQTIVFGVRAHDQYGREDDNTKTTSVVVSDAQMLAGTFPGCVSAAALNSNSVQVTVAFPAEATSMEVFRSGVSVGTVPIGKTTVVDVGLAEGGTYSYTCVAAIHGQPNLGATTVQAIIPYTSAPNFTGLKSVALTSTNGQVKLTWDNPGTGAAAAAFNVYMAPGPSAPTVNTDHLVATVTGDATSTVVSGLGGGIPYTFTVTACTTPTLCAGGTTSLTSNTLPSQGIPTTPGATLAAVSNGQIVITAPWTYQNGGISNRRIYRRNSSATNPVYITSSLGTFPYELLQTVPVSTAWAPPTLLTVTDVAANSTYYFIVRDESIDSPPYVSPNTSVVNVHTGTLTAPVFAGITSLTTGTSPESQLVVGFTAIAPEGSNTGAGQSLTGASNYNVYVTSAPPNNDGTPGTPSDSCNTSVVNRQISADSYHSGDPVNVTLAGLTSRYSYSVCVKAVNQENYVSVTTNSLTKTAQDLTPPVFYGIQSAKYNGNTNQIDLVWTPSTATDLLNYKISIAQGSQNTLLIKTPEQLSGVGRYSISSSDFAFTSGLVSVWVNACDNAAPLYGSSNNCTSYTVTNALMVSLPDLTPPSGFTGITSVTNTSPNATGSVLVNWAAPSSWFDVYGFNVYDVSNTSSPTLLKNCICTNVSGNTNGALGTCASANTSCTLNNLNAGRTYKFYVRAYNSANVETYLTNPNPITNNITFKTTNLVAPVFASNLAGYFANGSGIALNWNAATSNQYTGAPDNNTINYKIYRMQAASTPTFSNLAVPGNQVAQVTTVTNYTDPLAGLTDAVTYYYTICASDSNGNSTCDGVIQGITTPNMTPPTLSNIAGSRNLLTSSQPTFQLSWSMTDKATPTNQIVIAVRKKTTATSATDYPCTPLRFAASACGTVDSVYQQSAGLLSLANETGPANTNTWITYSLTATDTANNSKDYFFAIQSVLAPLATSIGSPSSSVLNSSGTTTFPVTYSVPNGSSATVTSVVANSGWWIAAGNNTNYVTVNTVTGNATCFVTVSGASLTSRNLALSNCTGNGTVTVSIATGTATDSNGNASSIAGPSATITVDNAAPTPTISIPVSNAYTNSTSNFAVSGACEAGLSVTISGSGVQTPTTVSCASGTYSGTITLASGDGTKAITVSQTDVAGNTGTSAATSINLLTTLPVVTITSPISGAASNTGGILFTGTCKSGLLVYFSGTGVPTTETTACTGGAYSQFVTFSAGDGSKTIAVSQTDLASNTSLPLSVSVVADTTAPVVTIGSPSSAAVNTNTAVNYTLSFGDGSGSGVAAVNMSLSNITVATTGTASCTSALTGSGLSTRTVTLSSCSGNGTVAMSVAAGVVTDNAGNNSILTGPSASFSVNNTAPTPTIVVPASSAYVNSASNLTVSGTCASGYNVIIAGTGVATGATVTCPSGTFSGSVSLVTGDGSKNITISQTDAVGNAGGANRSINLLTIAPTVTISAPAANTPTNTGALTFTGSCVAPPVGTNVSFTGAGVTSTQTTSCASDGSYSKVVTLSSSDGTKSVSVSQTDLAGNTSTPVSVNVIADTTPPAIAFGSPSSAAVNSSTTVTYAVNFSDTGGSGVASVNMSTSDVSLATTGSTTCTISGVTGSGLSTRTVSLSNCTGNGTIAIRLAAGIATDNASNSSAQTSYSNTFTVNNTPPSVAINSPSANAYTASTSVTVSGTCTSTYTVTIAGSGVATGATPSCSSGTYSANITLVTGDGSKTITASQTDSVGNIGTATRTVNLLTTAPVVTVSSPIPNMATNASSILFGGNCTSGLLVYFSGAGVSTTQTASCTSGTYSSFVTLSSGDGTKTVSIAQTDLAGNTSLALSVSVIKDTIAPTITFGTPSLSYANSSTSVSIATNFTDGGSGMASVNISTSNISLTTTDTATCTVASVTGTGTASRTVMLSSCSGDGTVAINVAAGVATDNASNASALTGPSSTFTVDNTAPTITITSPSNNSYTNSTSVTVSGACESGLTVTLAGSGLTATNTTSCTSGAYSKSVTLVSGDGTKSFTASQTDAAGNTGTTSALTINLLQTPPTVTITSPTVTTATNSGLLFTGSCKTGLAVVFSGSGVLNSPVIGSACASSSYSQYVTLTGSDGAKTVTVSQTDEASNVGSASVSVTFDTVKPALIISSPSLSAANSSKTISYTLSFSDTAGSGVASVSLSTSNITLNTTGTSCTKSVGGSGTSSRTVTLTNCTGDGTASITVAAGVATDNASNTSLAAGPSATFTVANTPPTLSVTSPAANSTYSTSFTLAGTCQTGLTVTITSAGISGSPVSTTCVAGAFSQGITLTGSDGSKTLTISEQDAAENTASTTLTVVRDSTAPSVAITSPANNTGLSSTSVTVPLTGTCETGLTVILGGNVPAGQTTTCASGTFTFSSWQINSGTSPYSVSVNVSQLDAAGNLGTSSSKTYNIDTTQVLPGYVSTVTSAAVSNTYFVNFTGTCMSGTDAGGSSYTTTATTSAGVVTGITCASNVLTIQVGMFTTGGSQSITVTPTTTRNANNATATSSASFTASPAAMLAFNAQTVPAGLHATFTGTCYSGTDLGGSGYTYASTTTLGTVARTTCSGGVLTVQVGGFTTGRPRTFTITTTATRTASSATATLTSASLEQYFSCPPNYVGVPGKWTTDTDTAGLGSTSATAGNATPSLDPTLDFCVMKYHAKNSVGYYAITTGFQTYYWFDPAPLSSSIGATSSYIFPQSRPDGIPIYNNQMASVATWCTALNYGNGLCTSANCSPTSNGVTYGYQPMSNTEWQVIARNLESVGANWSSATWSSSTKAWSDGTVGTGSLWRGHTDGNVSNYSDSNLFGITYGATSNSAGNLALSAPKLDTGISDYFGTDGSASINAQERRRFVLSTGDSIWDMAGNISQYLTDTRSGMGLVNNTCGTYELTSANYPTASDLLLLGSLGGYTSAKNAGKVYNCGFPVLARGGAWNDTSSAGLFSATTSDLATRTAAGTSAAGIRCVYIPPPTTVLNANTVTVAVSRTDTVGNNLASNASVTIANGGTWNLGVTVTDSGYSGPNSNLIYIQVYRKITNSPTDFPTTSSSVYYAGYPAANAAPFLLNETAWTRAYNSGLGQYTYTKNDGTYVNYLVTATDPTGAVGTATYSVSNTQSCPPGYVGVPDGTATYHNNMSGLGNSSASAGNSNAQLDPSRPFCMMKYSAKALAAGTTAAQNRIGEVFYPLPWGQSSTTKYASLNTYSTSYTSASFDSNILIIPESRAADIPWVNISQSDSVNACRSLQMQYFGSNPDTSTGTGFQLMSNTEWQVMARNIESTTGNWSTGTVGFGLLNRGLSNGNLSTLLSNGLPTWWGMAASITPSAPMSSSWNDNNGFFMLSRTAASASAIANAYWPTIGVSASSDQEKRTFNLSNGAIVWDIAGNAWNWVSDTVSSLGISSAINPGSNSWLDFNNATFGTRGSPTADSLAFGGYLLATSNNNSGMVYTGGNTALARGNYYTSASSGATSGVFSATTQFSTNDSSNVNVGFRCVYVPSTVNQPVVKSVVSAVSPNAVTSTFTGGSAASVGQTYYWTITGGGISAADFSQPASSPMAGSFVLDSNLQASVVHQLTASGTAGTRSLSFNVYSDSGYTTQVGITQTIQLTRVANTKLLVNGTGSNGGSTITDSSTIGATATVTNVTTSTAAGLFASSSMAFGGTNNYVSFPDNSNYAIGTNAFTLELWANFSSVGSAYKGIVSKPGGATCTTDANGFLLMLDTSTNKIAFLAGNGSWSVNLNSGTAPIANTWLHIAVTRDSSNVWRLFLNGALKASTTNTLNLTNPACPLYLGKYPNFPSYATTMDFGGYMSDMRFIVGSALYTSNFTPPQLQLGAAAAAVLINNTP